MHAPSQHLGNISTPGSVTVKQSVQAKGTCLSTRVYLVAYIDSECLSQMVQECMKDLWG